MERDAEDSTDVAVPAWHTCILFFAPLGFVPLSLSNYVTIDISLSLSPP
jgi:hypothetical protein